jgi:hypothetical protein
MRSMPTLSLPIALTQPVATPAAVVKSDLDVAIETLSRDLSLLCLQKLFSTEGPQHKATCLLSLSRILPAIKTVSERVRELDPGPMDGFALIDQTKGTEAVTTNSDGYCIFETEDAAWSALESLSDSGTPIDPRIGVRRIRMSMDKGVEFLEWVV